MDAHVDAPKPEISAEQVQVGAAKDARELSSTSTFEVISKHLFVRADELLANITMAVRDKSGKYVWITLESSFHARIMQMAAYLSKDHAFSDPFTDVKNVTFEYLLAILNGRPAADFFDKKNIEAKANRANRERKRLARKRARAAKRERSREEPKIRRRDKDLDKVAPVVVGQTRTCATCGKKFTSRKRLSKHRCSQTLVGKQKPRDAAVQTSTASPAKRARRAKARKARAERRQQQAADKSIRPTKADKSKADEVVDKAATNSAAESTADKKLATRPPVTGGSGSKGESVKKKIECEDCEEPAEVYKLVYGWKFPKCGSHYNPRYHDFECINSSDEE